MVVFQKLVLSLSQLDEEQPRQCVRSRLELLKALHIGKLVKRNKLSASPLDSMLELIVHFLLCHVRPSRAATAHGPRQEDLGRGGGTTPPEKVLGVGGNSPALSRPVDDAGQVGASAVGERFCPRVVGSLRDSHDPGRKPPQSGLGERGVSTLKADKGSETPGTNFAMNDVPTQRRNSLESRKYVEDLEQSVSVSDVSVRNVDILSNRDSDATESDTYDSDDAESESASSFASIVDLLKDGSTEPKGASRDSRRAVELTLKVPNAALVAATSPGSGVEDDLEVIDAGVDDGAQEERGIAAIGKREHQRASTWTRQGEEEEEGVSKGE